MATKNPFQKRVRSLEGSWPRRHFLCLAKIARAITHWAEALLGVPGPCALTLTGLCWSIHRTMTAGKCAHGCG